MNCGRGRTAALDPEDLLKSSSVTENVFVHQSTSFNWKPPGVAAATARRRPPPVAVDFQRTPLVAVDPCRLPPPAVVGLRRLSLVLVDLHQRLLLASADRR